MKNTLIITGGKIDKSILNKFLKNNIQIVIAADKGLEELDKLNIKPNYIIGDFDSINKNILNKYKQDKDIKIIELSPEKDYTDTHMAIKLAIELNSTEITILGAMGTRVDHILGNINILKECLENNVKAKIVDANNEISLINKSIKIKKDSNYKYISLIPLTTKVEGITLEGFKYELKNCTFRIGESIGISNEQIENIANIEIKNGILVLIKSKD